MPIISTNTIWRGGEIHDLGSSVVQIAYGATLTIEAGVKVVGGAIQVFGTLDVNGAANSPTQFSNVSIGFGSNSNTQLSQISISYANIDGGSILRPTGNAVYGSIDLTDSLVKNTESFTYVWYPTSDVHIARNVFVNSGGLSIGISGASVYVVDNVFYRQTTDYAVQNWASYSGSTVVENNSFLSTDRVALKVPSGYSPAAIAASDNFFGTSDLSVIDRMIYDKTDDLGCSSIVSSSHSTSASLRTPTYAIDDAPPTVITFSPADEATSVTIDSNIVLTFSEAIASGTGSILLKTSVGVIVAAYEASASTNLSIAGNVLTINPSADLAYSTGYKLEFAARTVKDLSGNSYVGIASYNFSTKPAPEANKTITGTVNGESFTGGSGNDTIDGGSGLDTAIFTGTRANYSIAKTLSGWTVSSTADGTDTLSNVERLQFADSTVALDISGIAGQAYRLYQAAFDRAPDAGGLGFWIKSMDGGVSLKAVAQGFVDSPEFKSLYGANSTNAQIVSKMYGNVLHRAPDQGGYAFWLGVLDRHDATVAEVLAEFGESNENVAALVGVIGNGFAFTPYGG